MSTIIGNNLKKFREVNYLTQSKVAEYLGIQRSTYSHYESGYREAPLDVLEKAAVLFGCELCRIFEDSDEVAKDVLTTSFRGNSISVQDMKEVAAFKNLIINYLKIDRLLAK